jgi:DNA topoisomerase-1
MSILVIVESPAKCKKIENYLGAGYKCAASFGHICDLDGGLKAIDVSNNFHPTFRTLPRKSKYIKNLRALIKKAKEVILATDDDREGEAIAWHICQVFRLPINTTKRIIFHEITKTALKKAIDNPTTINMNKVHAQQARQILDIMVGFKISPVLWKHISRNSKTGLSAGRCQTPALRLIYDNQKDIDDSPGKKAYDTTGRFLQKNIEFKLNTNYTSEEKMDEFLQKSVNYKHIYNLGESKNSSKKQPIPFTTSALQQKASNELHFSPKQTMSLAQKLYENGYITYMRTDSRTYSKEFIATAKKFITGKYGAEYVSSTINYLGVASNKKTKTKTKTKTKIKAQEAHEAIRPTKVELEDLPAKIDARAKRLYDLIRRNTVESCMPPAKYKTLTATITSPENHLYRYTAEQVVFPGWKIVGGYEKINPMYAYLQHIKQGSTVSYKKIYCKLVLKDLKSHYTEARLVQQLEKAGIGRPSTFSNIISKIQDRKYVVKGNIEGKTLSCTDFQLVGEELEEIETSRTFGAEKGKLLIQPIGIIVLEFLITHYNQLFVYEYTKQMEDNLDLISKGEKIWHTLCRSCNYEINVCSSHLKTSDKVTIPIDEYHTYMIARYGPVVKCEKDGETTWKRIKKGIDVNKLRNGEYKLDDIIEKGKAFVGRSLGTFKNKEVILKKGKYGLYIHWNAKNYSISFLKKRESSVKLEDVLDILLGKQSVNPNILKVITENISIRKGKYGPYIFYKTKTMKKPRFLKLKDYHWRPQAPADILTWIKEEYGI